MKVRAKRVDKKNRKNAPVAINNKTTATVISNAAQWRSSTGKQEAIGPNPVEIVKRRNFE